MDVHLSPPASASTDSASGLPITPDMATFEYTSLRRSTRSRRAVTIIKLEADSAGNGDAAPEPSTPTRSASTRKRKVRDLEHGLPRSRTSPLVKVEDHDVKPPLTPTPAKSTPKKTIPLAKLDKAHPAPARWAEQYALIERMRKGIVAPVDTMGCERPDLGPVPLAPSLDASDPSAVPTPAIPIFPSLPPITRRFHVLISLMLSSQTKDPVTSAAVTSLHHTLPGGLTAESLAAAPREMVEGCICKVGFWRRKAEFIQLAAEKLLQQEGEKRGDVPDTIEGLCELKGVGPKMAFLAMQCAWDIWKLVTSSSYIKLIARNAGIGVDVHVHRITNRLKWHRPPTITPEQTRVNLESWLPKELHKGINPMLVGFGQVICLPVGPRCDLCLLGQKRMCPSRVANVRSEGRKAVQYTFVSDDMEDLVLLPAAKVEGVDGMEELVKVEQADTEVGMERVIVSVEERSRDDGVLVKLEQG